MVGACVNPFNVSEKVAFRVGRTVEVEGVDVGDERRRLVVCQP